MNPAFSPACCSIAMRDRPCGEAIGRIAAAGFRGVELWYPHVEAMSPDRLREVRDEAGRLGVAIPVIAPYFSFTRGSERITESLKTAERVLAAADILGASKVRTFVDIGPDGLSSARARPGDWSAACAGLQELCALNRSVDFVIETHEKTLADTLPSVRRLLDEAAAPNLKLNFQANRDFLKRGYLECLGALWPLVSHLHWQQHLPDGGETYLEEGGVLDFDRIIRYLAARNYAGSASVEYCWSPVEEGRLQSAALFLAGLAPHSAVRTMIPRSGTAFTNP